MPALLFSVILGFILSFLPVPSSASSPQSTAPGQVRDLKSDDVAVRRRAAAQLSGMKELPPEILPVLRASIKDPDQAVAAKSAVALANAAPLALHEIDLALQDPDNEVRSRMTNALTRARQIGPKIWPLLIRAFTDAYEDVPYYAAQAFAKIGAPSLPLLQKIMHQSDPRLRRGACETLQRLGPLARPVSKDLLSALGDPAPAVRYQAAYALAEIDPEEGQPVPVLIQALEDSSWLTRIHACDALILLGSHGRAAVPSLLRRLAVESDVAIKERAAQALGKTRDLDANQIEQLAKSLQDKEPLVRKAAADALGELAPEAITAIPFLVRGMSDDVEWIRNAAAASLGRFGVPALPALAETLKSKNIYVRQAAIWAFVQMKPLPPAAVPILIAQLEAKNTEVSDRAAGAL